MAGASQQVTIADVIRDFRREQIVDAARRMFGERGSLEVSMTEIAEAAGVSRSTVYNYFSTREEVLTACLQAGQAQLVAGVDHAVLSVADPVERLAAVLGACISHVDQSPAFFRMMTAVSSSVPRGSEAATTELSLTGMRVGEAIRSTIAAGIDSESFDVDLDDAFALVGFVLVGLLDSRAANPETPASELARKVVDLLVSGLSTRTRRTTRGSR
jgi:AcrR family transcriptional regulator